MRSLVRWAGSKRQVLSLLREYWVGYPARYIEPFAGSYNREWAITGIVFLGFDRNRASSGAQTMCVFPDVALVLRVLHPRTHKSESALPLRRWEPVHERWRAGRLRVLAGCRKNPPSRGGR